MFQVFIVQHVDVCMFSNGKFKNVVAQINSQEDCPVLPGATLERIYTMQPVKGATKNWIALEDSYSKAGTSLASTVTKHAQDDRNVFAIYVSYYVKVKLVISAMGGEVALKLPFILMHSDEDDENLRTTTMIADIEPTKPGLEKTCQQPDINEDVDAIKCILDDFPADHEVKNSADHEVKNSADHEEHTVLVHDHP